MQIQQGALNDVSLLATLLLVSRYFPFFGYAFGLMMEKLIDQLRYGACAVVVVDNHLVAYIGWILVDDQEAQKWLKEGGELPIPRWDTGDAGIVTVLVAEDKKYIRPLIREAVRIGKGKKAYRMRSFQDGRPEMRRPPIKGW